MSSARSASTATASAPSRAALPARASAPKPAPGVTVDVVLPAERAIFTLEHVDAGAREICVALGPVPTRDRVRQRRARWTRRRRRGDRGASGDGGGDRAAERGVRGAGGGVRAGRRETENDARICGER
jgi:hypothetical protein